MNACPNGTAIIPVTLACGCDPTCLTCDNLNYLNCTLCSDISKFLNNGQCISSCPNSTYPVNKTCLACGTGCNSCIDNTFCLICLTNLYSFNGACYSDCNLISQQYDGDGGVCKLCPDGCDTCSGSVCSNCLADYSLASNSCVKGC